MGQAVIDFLPTILALALTGAIAGFGAGMFGIGGGAIIVPALFYTFKFLGYDASFLMRCGLGLALLQRHFYWLRASRERR